MRGALLAALLLALVPTGCGAAEEAEPTLPAPLAEALAGRAAVADRLSAGDPCAAAAEADRLVAEAEAAVDEGAVPAELQEELLRGAEELAAGIECPAEPAEPPPGEPEPSEAPAEVQTLVAGDAGEIDFRVDGDALELVEVRPASGWRHAVSADEDEIDVDFGRGNREIAVALDADGGGRLKLHVDYEAGRGAGPQVVRLGSAGEVALLVERGSLRLLHADLAAGWHADVTEDEDKLEVDARHDDGSELSLVVGLED